MALNAYLDKKVSVLTTDSRTIVGTLVSCDGSMNIVLSHAVERVIRPADEGQPSEEIPIGAYIIRGDNVAVCGRIDEKLDAEINWTKVHGDVIGTTKHV
ncbi:Sm-like ribonucleo protein [Corynespora cassiicola Philippines]|uniref:LSM2-LSM8 complex subunit LSM8 n=1 Tax=Corynespora cassiicola Philippines TaxID=1448308 RepID=A0A2T2N8I6_CORCC|nr:Sm-like ribonucleo protein [Corynespora cassiicola Philippines]